MAKTKINPEEILVIGDTQLDVLAAKEVEAGVKRLRSLKRKIVKG